MFPRPDAACISMLSRPDTACLSMLPRLDGACILTCILSRPDAACVPMLPRLDAACLQSKASLYEQLLLKTVKRFRGGLVFKAHRLVYHSTLGLRETQKSKKRTTIHRLT